MKTSELGTILFLTVICLGCQKSTSKKAVHDVFKNTKVIEIEPIFEEVSEKLGIDFKFETGHDGDRHFFPEIAAGGGALLDYNNDGRLDIYLLNGNFEHAIRSGNSKIEQTKPPSNRLFQQKDDGTFVDKTDESGIGDIGYAMGVAVGDLNNDGWEDIYVSNYGTDRLFQNLGDGSFKEISKTAKVENSRWGASVAFIDFDRDGWLDIYVSNYVDYFSSRDCYRRNEKVDYCGPSSFEPTVDKLFRNSTGDTKDGEIQFEDVTLSAKIGGRRGPGLGVAVCDLNNDAWPDIYVANDGAANFLLINQKDGTFRNEAIAAGAANDDQGRAQAGMGLALFDINRDEFVDILVTHQNGETNALYSGDGNSFQDQAVDVGLGSPSYQRTGFGAAFADFDLDGQIDLAVANGRVTRPLVIRELKGQLNVDNDFWNPYIEPNQLFMRNEKGKFDEVTCSTDPFFGDLGVSRGLCKGDIDNDGDIDLLVINASGKTRLYRNLRQGSGNWLSVRATIPQFGGRHAIGARVEVHCGKQKLIGTVCSSLSYFSAHDRQLHFGLGKVDKVDSIEVVWPDGLREKFSNIKINQQVNIEQSKGEKVVQD